MPRCLLKRLFPRDVHHVNGFHQELQAVLPQAGRLLDLGCGINADLARYRTSSREVWGADFEAHPELQHPQWFRRLSPEGAIPFPDAYFDAVASVMVLEHVADPDRFLGEVRRVLRPGGHFVGHTINGLHYVAWIRRLVGLLPHRWNQALVHRLYGRAGVDTFPTHYRLNNPWQLRRAARRSRLEPAKLRSYTSTGYFQFWRPLMDAAAIVDRMVEDILPGCGRLYFTITLTKRAGGESNNGLTATARRKSA